MKKFKVLSGTWWDIEAPDEETAREVYNAFWEDRELPKDCTMFEGEVDSIWTEQ